MSGNFRHLNIKKDFAIKNKSVIPVLKMPKFGLLLLDNADPQNNVECLVQATRNIWHSWRLR